MASSRRILVTGATGFVGRSAIEPLVARGFDVHILGRREQAGADRVTFHGGDLLVDGAAAVLRETRPSHLLHLAWISDRSRLWHSADNLAWVAATLALVRDFHAAGGVRAVLAGSSAEYDWSHHTLDEHATPLRPATLYGRSKQAVYELLSACPPNDVPSFAWARIFFPFGPNDKDDRLLSQVIDGVAAGKPVDCSSGEQVRPFLHVDDAAGALVALLDSGVTGSVNIALEETCSVRDLVLAAAGAVGDASLVRFGTRPLQAGEPPYMRAAVGRLRDEVGYVPALTIRDGVRRTVAERLARRIQAIV